MLKLVNSGLCKLRDRMRAAPSCAENAADNGRNAKHLPGQTEFALALQEPQELFDLEHY